MPLFSPMYTRDVRVDDKLVIVTGSNTGIGKETARELYKRGARVVMAVRNIEKGEAAKEEISKSVADSDRVGSLEVRQLDLQSMQSVKDFVASLQVDKVDILINNAGVMACPRFETCEGFEGQLGVNHLAHFLLTNLLLDKLKAAAPSRIVNLSSLAHRMGSINFDDLMSERSYSPWGAYSQSKLANILFTRQLSSRLSGSGVTVYAVHPGTVNTELQRNMPAWQKLFVKPLMWVSKTAVQGAQTSLYCALDPDLQSVSGRYYADCAERTPSSAARNDQHAQKLWETSEQLVGLSTTA